MYLAHLSEETDIYQHFVDGCRDLNQIISANMTLNLTFSIVNRSI